MRRATVLLLALFLALSGRALAQGNKQLMSEKMAVQDMKRMIVETIIGFKVKSQGEFGLTEDAQYKADVKAQAVIKDIKVKQVIYDKAKDIALAVGYIDLNGDIINVLGEKLSFKDVRVEGFGFGTMTESSRPPLRALRAAMINAYDEMGAALVGEKIYSSSTAENFVLTRDSNKSRVAAAVYGAYIPNPGINDPKRGWGWDESGNAFVRLEMDARKVRDLLGNLLVYKEENIISVVGRGAQVDELSTPQNQGGKVDLTRDPGSKTQYMELGVPGSQPPQDTTGKPGQ